MRKTKFFFCGRDTRTGQFTTIEEARKNPSEHVIDRVSKNIGVIPKELKSIILKPPKDARKESSSTILKKLKGGDETLRR